MNKEQRKNIARLNSLLNSASTNESLDTLLSSVTDLPESIPVRTKFGIRFFNDRKFDKASNIFQTIHQEDPENSKILEYCGLAYLQLGIFELSIKFFKKLVGKDNSNYTAWTNLCFAAGRSNNFTDAVFYAMQALALRPHESKAHQNMGSALVGLGRSKDALICFKTALELDPNNVSALSNIANIYGENDLPEKALEIYKTCLSNTSNDTAFYQELRYRMSFQHLKLGQLEEGWDCYECGLALTDYSSRTPKRKFNVPQWDGRQLNGKKLMIWREQGLGDEVLFLSIVSDVLKFIHNIIIECDPRLVAPLQRSFPECLVRSQAFHDIPNGFPIIEDYDFHIPVASLAKFFRSKASDFVNGKPYLKPDPYTSSNLINRFTSTRRKIGICWRSGKLSAQRNKNYAPISSLESIFLLKNVDFVNLQYGDCENEIVLAEQHFSIKIHRWSDIDLTNDLDSVISLISILDHVVSANTTVAEIALAVGTPLSTFRYKSNSWDMLGQSNYPWFPSNQINLYSPEVGQPIDTVFPLIASDLSRLTC